MSREGWMGEDGKREQGKIPVLNWEWKHEDGQIIKKILRRLMKIRRVKPSL